MDNLTADEKIVLDNYRYEQFLKEIKMMHESHTSTQSCAGCGIKFEERGNEKNSNIYNHS